MTTLERASAGEGEVRHARDHGHPDGHALFCQNEGLVQKKHDVVNVPAGISENLGMLRGKNRVLFVEAQPQFRRAGHVPRKQDTSMFPIVA